MAFPISQEPLFLTQSQAPLVMLNMARDHRLYYEAYNDYSDLNGDGSLDLGYKPSLINYYGYFDSFKCYAYNSTDNRFDPVSVTADKRCGGAYWSGDFLNYVTTSRMDALRKVLYGGFRKVDTTSLTVLERVFIPQDAHTWGKEYLSVANDGYDISDYTPLLPPASGRRHFFTNVTLDANGNGDGSDDPPLLRVLQNSSLRIWNWVSIERPVAGSDCLFGASKKNCVTGDTAGTGGWAIVPSTVFTGLNATFYDTSGTGITSVNSKGEMDGLKAAAAGSLQGSAPLSRIDCDSQESYTVFDDITSTSITYNSDCNPATSAQGTSDEQYFTEITGNITVPAAGTYYFAIDGNNNIDLFIDGSLVKGWYGNHSFSSCKDSGDFDSATCNPNSVGSVYLTAGTHSIQLRHHEYQVYDGYRLWWKVGSQPVSLQNYTVRVKVCDNSIGLESNCTSYTDGTTVTYKPTGLLHNYGANNGMYFGLLSGSYKNNLQGGVLRKNISSFQNEFSPTTGIFTSSPTNGGIVDTINRFRITSFVYGSGKYNYSCGWITTRAINNGECEVWGNPLGEMVWETLRYLNGQTSPTSGFNYSSGPDVTLGLPSPTWWDPYSNAASRSPSSAFPYCAKPYIMAVSDSYPSFDSDSVPGSTFGGVSTTLTGISNPNVKTLGDTMWNTEFGGPRDVFIGQSGTTSDSGPTAKAATSFGNLRGLAPSDPTRQGSYSSSALAYWSRTTDLRSDQGGDQKTGFYSVALAPPLPTIEVPVSASSKVTIVPFAKSVGGSSISASSSAFQPTNQIVDFYVDTIKNTDSSNIDSAINGGRPFYRFRINYEDVEQGADHDMDALAIYEIWLNADNTISINVVSEYAAGGIMQHMGYVISGTSADGTYLVVRDKDTGATSDPDYFLDTPRTTDQTNNALPLNSSSSVTIGTPCTNSALNFACRTFSPDSSATSAILLKDPLWYAAKWGGFKDDNANLIPDPTEWDADTDGTPDNYFLVVNPLKLEIQMAAALAKIASDSGTAAALAANSTSLRTDLILYQARFSSDGWGGELNAYPIKSDGTLDAPAWQAQYVFAGIPSASTQLDPNTRVVLTYDPDVASASNRGIPFRWSSMGSGGSLQTLLDKAWNTTGGSTDGRGAERVDFLRGGIVSGFRTRPCITGTSGTTCVTNYLGDIVNSSIQYVGAPAFGYSLPHYADYFSDRYARTKMIYVGGNDGILHGFDADTGVEKIAYIPSALYRGAKLSKLTAADYGKTSNPHAYYVDGTPNVGDICADSCAGANNWKTILVGGLGGGGQGVYALNVSRPEDFSETNASSLVMWEFKDTDDADLGYTYSRPAIVRMCTSRDSSSTSVPKTCTTYKWVVIFGNGYNSTETDGNSSSTGRAVVYILDSNNGAMLNKIEYTGGGSPNGFANISPADVDGDGIADYLYAGDLFGNMVKLDLETVSSVSVTYTLYTALDSSSVPQPITSSPELYAHPNGGVMVLFGTGKYLEVADKTSSQQHTFYGIWDNGSAVSPDPTRSNLQAQYLVSDSISSGGVIYSTSTRNAVDWDTKKGWYLDLTKDGSNPSERVAYDPQILGTILNFVTVLPSTDVCAYGGDSYDFLLDPITGGSLDYAAFSGITAINTGSYGTLFASRRKSTVGISPTGTTITVGKGSGYEYKGGSTGNIEKFGVTLKAAAGARLSWRELSTD